MFTGSVSAARRQTVPLRVLLVSNMYPSPKNPRFGSFVRQAEEALVAGGIKVDRAVSTDSRTGALRLAVKYLVFASRGAAATLRGGYGQVHAHYLFPSGIVGLACARARRVPLVLFSHGSDVLLASWRWPIGPLTRWVTRRADMIVCASDHLREQVVETFDVPPDSVVTIPTSVDTTVWRRGDRLSARERTGLDSSAVYLLFAGALDANKGEGFEDVIGAITDDSLAHVRVVRIGEGPRAARLDSLALGAGVSDRIDSRGFVTQAELADLYRAVDIVVVPSRRESLGLVALEAEATGTPVVATRVGGLPEHVVPGVDGELYEPGDVPELVSALTRVLVDPGPTAYTPSIDEGCFGPDGVTERLVRLVRDVGPTPREREASSRARRARWLISAFLVVLLGVMSVAAWLQPKLVRVDAERLELARSVPYQTLNLVDYDAEEPRHYYVDMRVIAEKVRTGEYADPPLDERGVPVVDYTHYRVAGASDSRAYNPITTSQYGLALYEEYLRGESDSLAGFFAQADWLVETMASDGGLYYTFDLPDRNLEAPWLSGMAQGEAISVLVRAYYESGDARYLQAARLAFEPLTRPFDDNGVMYVDHTGTWLEEYPEDPPSHVLNGALFAVFGLYDLERATGDERVGALFEESVETLADNLERYEADGWVRYQLTAEDAWAIRTYYGLHIEQLRALAALTGDARFEERAEKWERPFVDERRWLMERALVRFPEKVRSRLGQ